MGSEERPEKKGAALVFIAYKRVDSIKKTLPLVKNITGNLYLFKDGKKPKDDTNEAEEIINIFKEIAREREYEHKNTFILTPIENLGQRDGPPTAIKWMLEKEGEGIILEEDILVDPEFYDYYSKALGYYRENKSIFAISSGVKNSARWMNGSAGCISNILKVWGWATWKDRFEEAKIPNDLWAENREEIIKKVSSIAGKLHLAWEFDILQRNPQYCWSYYIIQHLLKNNLNTIVPASRLTENIGIGVDALRTKEYDEAPTNRNDSKNTLGRLYMKNGKINIHPFDRRLEKNLERSLYGGIAKQLRVRLAIKSRLKRLVN
jgi:hypothetical protein